MRFKKARAWVEGTPGAAQPRCQGLVGWIQPRLSSQPGARRRLLVARGPSAPASFLPVSPARRLAPGHQPPAPAAELRRTGALAALSAAWAEDGDSWMKPPGSASCCQTRAQLSKIMSAQPTCISLSFALRERRFL